MFFEEKVRQKYEQLVDSLLDRPLFIEFLKNPNFEHFQRWLKSEDAEICYCEEDNDDYYLIDNIKIQHGVTKMVFSYCDRPNEAVIKIPFKTAFNYCEKEAEYYRRAGDWRVENFFASAEIFGSYIINSNLVDIYIMAYAPTNTEKCYEFGLPYLKNLSWIDSSEEAFDELEEDWESRIYAIFSPFYDGDEISELVNFINEYDINDLHLQNIGFTDEGIPVLIDYSGFGG